ncbi:amidohydrolase family protein (plasmid) [Deinococcus sp. KNUC1210]|uniref:amidohydrolase family protein n=1 Tax=Deinococcus sp. KNUC1210 TaxID=2917691 RepID=UPI001EEFA4C6|nr:amidohydrolase family protein [Deinococcus sp. KNUC1210]ULH17062.1 amidohydrolase family protein [Deinococcus sp. KNUC1210]
MTAFTTMLEHIPLYDHHAHALYHEPLWRAAPLGAYFTEAYDPVILEHFVSDTLFYRRSLRDLAELYSCEPNQEGVQQARLSRDYAALCTELFQRSNIGHLLIDDGFWPDRLWTVEQSREHLPVPIRRVVRSETELQELLPFYDSVGALLDALEERLREAGKNAAGFKSIIAYRTGLEISRPTAHELEHSFQRARKQGGKLLDKPLLDAALWRTLRIAADLDLPVQFHTGYGDPDLDLRLADPLNLRSVIEAPELRTLKLVLLHCYPFVREAGYLASVYSGVYLDLGLTIPYTSVAAMKTALHEALHLSPISKLLISTDAQRTPELFWLAARWARRTLGTALEQTVQDGDLTSIEAEWAAERVLWSNAAELYPETATKSP